jgi:hypothetical protein
VVISVEGVCEWFAHLSSGKRLSPDTLRAYASALRTSYDETTLAAGGARGENPMSDPLVERTLVGARKLLGKARAASRTQTAPVTPGVQLSQLDTLRPRLLPLNATAQQRMEWAALRCAVEGMLRPNELLGSTAAARPPLQVTQLQFFNANGRECEVGELMAPTTCTIQLGVAKNDAIAAKGPKTLRDSATVRALWAWLHERRRLHEERPHFFAFPGHKLSGLRLRELLATHLGKGYTLKAFRRGGAAMRVARGDSIADIKAAGAWTSGSDAMVRLYAGPGAFAEREILTSSSARPAAAAASSRGR